MVARTAALAGAVAVIVLSSSPLAGQAPAGYQTPRTPWGDPDLQGIWPSTEMVGVPLERPVEFGTRALLSDTEFTQRQAQTARQAEIDAEPVTTRQEAGGDPFEPSHWAERGTAQRRNSLIVEPDTGRMPKMTPYGAERMAMRARHSSTGDGPFDAVTDLDYYDRCISRGALGSIMPVGLNNGTEIVQGPGYVAIRYEMIHDARIIALDPSTRAGARPRLSAAIRQYMGDARGHWDGDTLVVETSNFNGTIGMTANGRLRPASDALEMVERFTRTGPDAMQYQATVNDPKTWTAPWTVSFPLTRDDAYGFYEYACHEGNNAMRNILSGARAAEK